MKTFLTFLFLAFATFLTPIKGVLLIVGFSIFLNATFDVWKAKRRLNNRKCMIIRRALYEMCGRMVLFQLVVITFYSIDVYVFKEFAQVFTSIKFFLTKVVSLVLISIELYSIDSTFKQVKGFSLWAHFSKLVKLAKNVKDKTRDILPLLLLVLVFGSCDPVRRHEKIVKKYPYVHRNEVKITKDTITLTTKYTSKDSLFFYSKDTVRIEKENLKIRFFENANIKYIKGECLPIKSDTIIQRIEKTIYSENAKYKNWGFYGFALSAFLTVLAIVLIFKAK